MSKKAEERALEAYPPTHSDGKRYPKRVQSTLVDTHQPLRTIFQRAYEQAEKDTIKRAVEWWRPRLQGILSPGLVDGIIEEFRNGMK